MATKGSGTTIAFGTSGWTAVIRDVGGPNVTRGKINTSHMGTTGYETYVMETLIDGGDMTFDCEYDGNDSPPIDQAPETITIVFAGTKTVSFTGAMSEFSVTAPVKGELMRASFTLAVCGDITGL